MTQGIEFRFASHADDAPLRGFLAGAGLPSANVSADRQEYVLAHSGQQLVGCVGLEVYGDAALLRSLAVATPTRALGLGTSLTERVLALASLRGAKTAFLLTTTAERFFAKRGFERVDRTAVPAAVAASAEFSSLCPASAVCMRRRLDTEARHFPSDILRLRPDVRGASMWAVALDRAMLTYFEIEPNSRFERHSHASEQITMVLDGELFFETPDGREVLVRAGEVIAIPANAPHAAWTRERSARAVDAWSPVRTDFMGSHGLATETERTTHPSPPRPSLTTMANGME